MAKRKSRIIVDTNLWISLLLTKDYQKFDSMLDDQNITLIFSEELLNELIEVTRRPKFKKHFEQEDVDELIAIINRIADFIAVTTIVNICRDPKDNFLLALALDGKADYLITGDQDLLVLKTIKKTSILSMTEYLS
ncbi:MAG: putative toxin-antitoxin system toxin component, PIN family [Bacteroidetes bacterium]|nr:putative toxin-antitoxin system toxin component, PIN family [Bacteroidota bacterium]MBS1686193.1 putative toxin-antitoxin system toxin component, PIN family [Bacteroidota bacterium]